MRVWAISHPFGSQRLRNRGVTHLVSRCDVQINAMDFFSCSSTAFLFHCYTLVAFLSDSNDRDTKTRFQYGDKCRRSVLQRWYQDHFCQSVFRFGRSDTHFQGEFKRRRQQSCDLGLAQRLNSRIPQVRVPFVLYDSILTYLNIQSRRSRTMHYPWSLDLRDITTCAPKNFTTHVITPGQGTARKSNCTMPDVYLICREISRESGRPVHSCRTTMGHRPGNRNCCVRSR